MAPISYFSQNVISRIVNKCYKYQTKDNILVQLIKHLEVKQMHSQSNKPGKKETKLKSEGQNFPKRNSPSSDLPHRGAHSDKQALFSGYTFCFPIIDKQITAQQKELFTQCIQMEGGKVMQFKEKPIKLEIDFLLVSKQVKPQVVSEMVQGKLNYKEMLDYSFITDSLKEGRLQNFERYSLYVNVAQMWNQEQHEQQKSHKKVKRESDDDTVKLSDEEKQKCQISIKNEEKAQKNDDEREEFVGRRQMEDLMLSNKNPDHKFPMNKYIADELTKLMKIYQTERDIGRKIAYMKAAAVIKSHDKEIESEKDIENIKGIGKKISDKIKQLLTTGKINKLETLQLSQKNIILGQFCKIWGIGPSKAQELYNSGIKSIEQLRKRTDLLTKNQKLGLKYHEQFETKIPRQKITKMFEYIKGVLSKLTGDISQYRMQVCGSYRRGKAFCGDMDIIISRKDGVYEKHLLENLANQLQKTGFLTDHLTHPKVPDNRSSISYMGVCKFQQETHHRIDIKYYPIEQFSYAILYFTGSGMFNRMLRLHCMKLGLSLSDHGLTPKMEKGVIWSKPIPNCYTEEDIFKFLGVDFKAPKDRQM